MAGTIPLSIQVPARDPIKSKIKILDMAEDMLLTMPS